MQKKNDMEMENIHMEDSYCMDDISILCDNYAFSHICV